MIAIRQKNPVVHNVVPLQPGLEEQAEINKAIQASVNQTLDMKAGIVPNSEPVTTIRLHGEEEYTVRIAEKKLDPIDPSRFRNRKAIPLQQEDPAPLLAKPEPKLTPEEEEYWKIPTCVSQYRNPAGYVIPMDKRMAADARRFLQPQLSDRFSAFSKILDATTKAIHESNKQQDLVGRQLLQKKQQEEEEQLRAKAKQLRDMKNDLKKQKSSEERYRDEVLHEHHEERQRIKRKLRERDVSEHVALGHTIVGQPDSEELFDPQLFGKTSGIGPGYSVEDTDNPYDRPLFTGMDKEDRYIPFGNDRGLTISKFADLGKSKSSADSVGPRDETVKFGPGILQKPTDKQGLYQPSVKEEESD